MSQNEHIESLRQIRSMMERSTRFISLSGLSGVAAGICALIGATFAYLYLDILPFDGKRFYYVEALSANKWGMDYVAFFILDAALVMTTALVSGVYFTTRKARQKGQKIWDPLVKRLLINLAIPLGAGGIFCLALFFHGYIGLIAPTTLVFYGIALLNGSKYTFNDIRYLGLSEIILGLISLFYLGYGLEFWAIGFGVLHIVYGMVMYVKYERNLKSSERRDREMQS